MTATQQRKNIRWSIHWNTASIIGLFGVLISIYIWRNNRSYDIQSKTNNKIDTLGYRLNDLRNIVINHITDCKQNYVIMNNMNQHQIIQDEEIQKLDYKIFGFSSFAPGNNDLNKTSSE